MGTSPVDEGVAEYIKGKAAPQLRRVGEQQRDLVLENIICGGMQMSVMTH